MKADAGHINRPSIAATEDQSTAYVYRLPNELLQLTFTFLFHQDESVHITQRRSKDRIKVKPVLIVRWVCSWFRSIASQHSIWLDPQYSDLSAIFPCRHGNSGPVDIRDVVGYNGKYIEALLDDDLLRHHLKRKSEWKFSAASEMRVVAQRDSSLISHIKSVELEDMEKDIRWIILDMTLFTNLTKLTIRRSNSHLFEVKDLTDLDTIAYACPLLEDISLALGDFHGSLAPLQNVKTVYIEESSAIKYTREDCNLVPLLPLQSARVFNSFTFLSRLYPNEYYSRRSKTKTPFDPFQELSTIEICSKEPEILDFIANSKFQLHNLTLVACADRPDAVLRLLCATSLRNLKTLSFKAPDLKIQQSHILALGNLEYLESVSFQMCLEKVWWYELAGFKRFRKLAAYIMESEFDKKVDGTENLDEFILAVKEFGGFTKVETKDCSTSIRRIFVAFYL